MLEVGRCHGEGRGEEAMKSQPKVEDDELSPEEIVGRLMANCDALILSHRKQRRELASTLREWADYFKMRELQIRRLIKIEEDEAKP